MEYDGLNLIVKFYKCLKWISNHPSVELWMEKQHIRSKFSFGGKLLVLYTKLCMLYVYVGITVIIILLVIVFVRMVIYVVITVI
jgi:hypothetical protein